ncbi:acetyl-CoA carboxylase biotin carboxylase subunit [Mangrovibacterium marinum]|uniref:Biotin carboxylase n=1 Tax=Mangrovibacterium marinum TaxID=1639118 RepID=A0A2T5C0B3_9BACT|nr:acetyl-CoA carboxylase biotin carboxylase subunit [Mangrovibacterium marinum]PTN08029.1 biotin carboxylase [Mangrovibacterium marinum]
MRKINKILVANRGEIAIRIMRTCREMNIATVAVFSDADRTSMHVRYADEAYYIGPAPSKESYLRADKIIDVALKSKADAIHPGYGFLSENAEFAKLCSENKIVFIGPSAEVIVAMGDKIQARKAMIAAGVPVVPGTTEAIASEDEALEIIAEIGLPVMIKASAGGGGKGMRLVTQEAEILSSVRAARSEALAAFNDDAVYIEKYVSSPHHIEFQVMGDQHGNVIHLFERECSIQRRHQKMVEETPSPLMTAELRAQMGADAVNAAKAVNYVGAGTIEFLVDDQRNYYFLEMNTRLQVEHPITERVTGVDLVKQQILVAEGHALEYQQQDLAQKGHAIECRIYAEDSDNNFMPSAGRIHNITEPLGLGVRTDGYVYEGYEIPIHYDPMISKLIVWASNREEAIQRMRRALYEYKITGVKTSIKFLERIMDSEDFRSGNYDTTYIEKNRDNLLRADQPDTVQEDMVIIATYIDYLNRLNKVIPTKQLNPTDNRWKKYTYQKNFDRL